MYPTNIRHHDAIIRAAWGFYSGRCSCERHDTLAMRVSVRAKICGKDFLHHAHHRSRHLRKLQWRSWHEVFGKLIFFMHLAVHHSGGVNVRRGHDLNTQGNLLSFVHVPHVPCYPEAWLNESKVPMIPWYVYNCKLDSSTIRQCQLGP